VWDLIAAIFSVLVFQGREHSSAFILIRAPQPMRLVDPKLYHWASASDPGRIFASILVRPAFSAAVMR
jgi:hypothetical protein